MSTESAGGSGLSRPDEVKEIRMNEIRKVQVAGLITGIVVVAASTALGLLGLAIGL